MNKGYSLCRCTRQMTIPPAINRRKGDGKATEMQTTIVLADAILRVKTIYDDTSEQFQLAI